MKKKNYEYQLLCLKKYGTNPLSYLTLSEDLSIIKGEWDGYIAYKSHLKSAVVLGDPIVSDGSMQDAVRKLKQTLCKNKYHICLFLCKEKMIKPLHSEGFKGFCFGQDAIVNLNDFNLSGKQKWSIRSSINYAKKHNMTVEEYKYSLNRSKHVENEIKKISEEWITTKKEPELTFAFGHIDFERNKETRYFIIRYKGEITGFLTYYPIYRKNSYYLDLTRRKKNSLRGTIDYLMINSFEILKKEGIKKIYIGGSPLFFQQLDSETNLLITTVFFKVCKPFFELLYPAKSELFFKKKYATEWEPYYIFYHPRFSLRIFLSIIHAIYEGGIISIIIHKLKYLKDSIL
jgi:phosphatidylglycerol lysyltransferase